MPSSGGNFIGAIYCICAVFYISPGMESISTASRPLPHPTPPLCSGHFITLDSDWGDYQNDEVAPDTTPQRGTQGVLLSPVLDQEDWSCLRLVYQITGSGTLQVQQRREGKSFDRSLWSSRTPSDSWVIASIDLQNNTESYRVTQTSRFTHTHTHTHSITQRGNRRAPV